MLFNNEWEEVPIIWPEFLRLVDTIKQNEWGNEEKKMFKEFYGKIDELTIMDNLLFRYGSKCIPNVRLRSKIMVFIWGSVLNVIAD